MCPCRGCGASLTLFALWLLISLHTSNPSTSQACSISSPVLQPFIAGSFLQPVWIIAWRPALTLISTPASQSSIHAHILLCSVSPATSTHHYMALNSLIKKQCVLFFQTICVQLLGACCCLCNNPINFNIQFLREWFSQKSNVMNHLTPVAESYSAKIQS